MFTSLETDVIGCALRDYGGTMAIAECPYRVLACQSVKAKLEVLEDCKVTLYCSGCEEDLELEAFAGHHVCRGCGKRLCDACYEDNGSTCGNPKCEDWEKWERADYEYDRRKDR